MDLLWDYLYYFPVRMWHMRYLNPEPVFKDSSLSIRGIGIFETMPPCYVERPEGTGDFLFMVFHDPVCVGRPPTDRPVPAGSMIFWNRTAAHHYGSRKHRWSHSWVHCDGPAVKDALRRSHISSDESIHLFDPSRIGKYLFDLHDEISGRLEPDREIVRNTLTNLIREAARSKTSTQQRPVPEHLLRVREILDTHYAEEVSLQRLSRAAGLSIAHLCTEFRSHFGVPPITYLIHRRLNIASRLLRETSLAVGIIGQRVGYDDPYYFSKLFKSHTGMTPSSLRVEKKS